MSENVFFTSDLHFCHNNIIEGQSTWGLRKFSDTKAMNAAILDSINSTVGENDKLYILGDVGLGNVEKVKSCLEQIRCNRVTLVAGNHDSRKLKRFCSEDIGWEVVDYKEVRYFDRRFVLFHFPISCWNGMDYGSIHLHGHMHGKPLSDSPANRMDVGVDTREQYEPYHIDEIMELLKI